MLINNIYTWRTKKYGVFIFVANKYSADFKGNLTCNLKQGFVEVISYVAIGGAIRNHKVDYLSISTRKYRLVLIIFYNIVLRLPYKKKMTWLNLWVCFLSYLFYKYICWSFLLVYKFRLLKRAPFDILKYYVFSTPLHVLRRSYMSKYVEIIFGNRWKWDSKLKYISTFYNIILKYYNLI